MPAAGGYRVAQALRTVARSPVDNLAQSVDGGHSLRLHPGRPPPGPGCPPPPDNGGTPPNSPAALRAAQLLKFPRSPKTATVAPVPGTLRLGDRGSRARCAKARQGRSPGGLGCKPPAWERPRRGGDRASEAQGGYGRPPLGGYLPRRGEQHCAAMYSESTFLQSGRAGATLGGMKYAILRTQS